MSSTNMPSSFDGDTILRIEPMAEADPPVERRAPRASGYASSHSTNALYHASKSIRSGDQQRTNRMFRARIYAQGFTIVAMVVAERKAKEKNDLWIKELEARDKEEKETRAEKERRSKPQVRAAEGKDSEDASSVVDGKEKKQKSTLESVKEMIMGKK
ncbi:hypothetical protein GMDG_06404 [Pseudogymnoascus destructans 20631-21]|uniref:HIG1 domain-containing protein n=1 Tax=Pseudogymnoascus destructans (strain ATCC MYA-4855 / 20631-21) TaxID=658429 RepID=L8FTH4_PSED2|nr:hypothetical protein GMDG_06404 [Pseudogymnoascus destructans 20631-21]